MAGALVVNARFIRMDISGVRRYAKEISTRLPGNPRLIAPAGGWQGLRGQMWEQLVLPRLVSKDEILWSPANSGPLTVPNQVVSIHDTLFLDHPEWFQPILAIWYRFLLPRLARKAKAVLTVSEFSRQNLIQRLNLAAARVIKIPAGVDLQHFFPVTSEETFRIREKFKLGGDYFLFVGALEPRRNLSRLIETWSYVRAEYPRLGLVIAGNVRPGKQLPHTLYDVPGVKIIPSVSEADLPALYSGAISYVSPSLEEGFGLPVLEAMACGVPVIAMNSGAYPEVVGNAGILVDPLAEDSLAVAMMTLVSDAQAQAELCYRGLERARQFSWEAAARSVVDVLKELGSAA
jgi:glycosyltransferase involved in cell wall biosynthesis